VEAVDLGKLFKVKIRHDNSMLSPAWFLDRVEINDGQENHVFHCERWLAKNKDDGKIERTLYVKVRLLELFLKSPCCKKVQRVCHGN
jgi:hypothetical protein